VTDEDPIDPEVWKLATNPWFIHEWMEDMRRYAVRDNTSKLATIITFTSAHVRGPSKDGEYTTAPLNDWKKGGSGLGKTKTTTCALPYFPEENRVVLCGASRTSFVHDHGTLTDHKNIPIQEEESPTKPQRSDYEKGNEGNAQFRQAMEQYKNSVKSLNERMRSSYYLIKLHDKTIVFLESPSEELLKVLYPVLSHDVKQSVFKVTEKIEGKNRTKTVVLDGWPACILLTATEREEEARYLYEMVTRCISDTPEESKEKTDEACDQANKGWSQNIIPQDLTVENRIKKLVSIIIQMFRDENYVVTVPFDDIKGLFPDDARTNYTFMRRFNYLLPMIACVTALHMFQRPISKRNGYNYVFSTVDDVIVAYLLYSNIWETSSTGLPQKILTFYDDVALRHEGETVEVMTSAWNYDHKPKVSDYTIRSWLKKLSSAGYVRGVQGAPKHDGRIDNRAYIYYALVREGEKPEIERLSRDKTSLRDKLRNRFEIWLKNNGGENQVSIEKKDGGEKEVSSDNILYEDSLHKFVNTNSSISLQHINMEEFKQMICNETSLSSLEELKREISSTQTILNPQSISKEGNSPKTGNQQENERSSQDQTISSNCALCDKRFENVQESQSFKAEDIEESETRNRWIDKFAQVHRACLMDLRNKGHSCIEIAQMIEDYEQSRGKRYIESVEKRKGVQELFRIAIRRAQGFQV